MKGTIEANKVEYFRPGEQDIPYVRWSIRYGGYLDATHYDGEWNFDNASDAPWIGVYIPSEEGPGVHYGEFRVGRNSNYNPLPDEEFASSYASESWVYSGPDHSDNFQKEWDGANVFNSTIYNFNFYTPLERARAIGSIGPGGNLILCNSLIYNNIPFFKPNENNVVDITREDLYMGCAYKNGIFYQEPFDLSNPYEDYESEDEGGPGTSNWDSDPIPERDLPRDYYGESGLVTIWTPTSAELKNFGNYLWSNNGLDMNQLKKIVNNPFDLVLGLQWLPLKVTIAGQKPVNVGNILGVDTGLQMSYPTHENYRFDFGSINEDLWPESESFVSYSPYTRMSISIPFIGKQAIDCDLIRKYTPVNLKMKYNIVNGTICAYLYGKDETLLYQWLGNVPSTIPVAQNDHTTAVAGMAGIVAGAVGGAVTGAVVGGAAGAVVGGLSNAVAGAASADLKPSITTTGSYSGNGSSLNATSYAYIEVMSANLSIANSHKHYLGYPRNTSGEIKSSYGFNSVKAVRVGVERATDSEKEEIKQILETGYIYGDISYDPKTKKQTGSVIPKPAIIADDSLQLMLYQTGASNIRIDKDCHHLHTYSTLTLKEPCSIQEPIIKLSASDTNMKKGNYAYIPKFDRFYYITDVTSLPGGLWEIHLKCDVLMSFREEIIDNNVVFNHSEWAYNLYLNDGSLQIDSRPRTKLTRFPNPLHDDDGTYVLIMAGGNLT